MDLVYPVVIKAARAWFKLGDVRIDMTGAENIPTSGGALIAVNHLSFVDYIMAGLPGADRGRLTRFIAKQEVFRHRIGGPVMRSFHHLPIDRADGEAGMRLAVERLQAGEVVGIFPEGTISRSYEISEIKTGAVRIAAEAGVPLIPVVLWGTQRFLTKGRKADFGRHKTVSIDIGEPLFPTGDDPVAETAELKARMEAMLDGVIRRYPADEQPPGSWWLPASRGGSAPTPEEARAMYVEERRLRAERKAERGRDGA